MKDDNSNFDIIDYYLIEKSDKNSSFSFQNSNGWKLKDGFLLFIEQKNGKFIQNIYDKKNFISYLFIILENPINLRKVGFLLPKARFNSGFNLMDIIKEKKYKDVHKALRIELDINSYEIKNRTTRDAVLKYEIKIKDNSKMSIKEKGISNKKLEELNKNNNSKTNYKNILNPVITDNKIINHNIDNKENNLKILNYNNHINNNNNDNNNNTYNNNNTNNNSKNNNNNNNNKNNNSNKNSNNSNNNNNSSNNNNKSNINNLNNYNDKNKINNNNRINNNINNTNNLQNKNNINNYNINNNNKGNNDNNNLNNNDKNKNYNFQIKNNITNNINNNLNNNTINNSIPYNNTANKNQFKNNIHNNNVNNNILNNNINIFNKNAYINNINNSNNNHNLNNDNITNNINIYKNTNNYNNNNNFNNNMVKNNINNNNINNNINNNKINNNIYSKNNNNNINYINNNNNNNFRQQNVEQKYIFPTKGLDNIGSTCYMNSTLQCLLHVSELVNYFLYEYKNDKDTLKNKNKNSSTLGKISEAFYELVLGVNPNNNKNENKTSKKSGFMNFFSFKNEENSFSPQNFKETLGVCNPQFKDFKANDSKDLLLYLLQTMHEELNYFGDNPPIRLPQPNQCSRESTFMYFMNIYNSQNFSIISKIFYGTYEIITTCHECYRTIYNFQKFEFISFGMFKYKKKHFDIMDGFKDNEEPQILKGNNKFYCNKCKELMEASLSCKIIQPPFKLILNIDYGKNKKYQPSKINFDEIIDIKKYVNFNFGPRIRYELTAICTHLGSSGEYGHYITFCKNKKEQKWYSFNDSSFNEIENKKEIYRGSPYILLYEKID